jgi:hypothetical protein
VHLRDSDKSFCMLPCSIAQQVSEVALESGTIFPMTPYAPYPLGRPRRLRRDEFTRNLVRENTLTAHDLIYPVFVVDGKAQRVPIASMPGVERLSLDLLLPVAEECVKLEIPVMALFPVIDQSLKDYEGSEALNPDGLIPRVVRALKKEFPQSGRHDRRGAGPLHHPWPGRPARQAPRGERLHPERRNRGHAGASRP